MVNRNPNTGTLSERSGKAAYISSDGTSGDGSTCRTGRALNGGYAGALAPDGQTLYFSEYNANGVAIFHVSPTTGAFSQLPASLDASPATARARRAQTRARRDALSRAPTRSLSAPAGRTVYVSSYGDNGVALFHATPYRPGARMRAPARRACAAGAGGAHVRRPNKMNQLFAPALALALRG